MKILRVRRGFTTNSSSANEFIDGGISETPPPQSTISNPMLMSFAAPVRASASASASASPSASPSSRVASSSGSTDSTEWGAGHTQDPASSTGTAGVLLLVVVGAFVVGPLVRFFWKRSQGNQERDAK